MELKPDELKQVKKNIGDKIEIIDYDLLSSGLEAWYLFMGKERHIKLTALDTANILCDKAWYEDGNLMVSVDDSPIGKTIMHWITFLNNFSFFKSWAKQIIINHEYQKLF